MRTDRQLNELVGNAIDFLQRAIAQFESSPKHSIINFYAALELFLKARLLPDHWSLVVRREADWAEFIRGDFESVTYDEARRRLAKIIRSPLSESAHQVFDQIRKHRNRAVHFFVDTEGSGQDASAMETVSVASQQLIGWLQLHRLLRVQWKDIFEPWQTEIDQIERRLAKHREYLEAKFKTLEVDIATGRNIGLKFLKCESCHFEASRVETIGAGLERSLCIVCDATGDWLEFSCQQCEAPVRLYEGGWDAACEQCSRDYVHDELVSLLNEDASDETGPSGTPANCHQCGQLHEVIQRGIKFVCLNCFALSDDLSFCGWCGEGSTGNLKDSTWNGCEACEGRAGVLKND